MKFKTLIKQIMPYCLVNYINDKRFGKLDRFYTDRTESKLTTKTETNPYKYIVSVGGFGNSGSGAVIDILREIPKATVIGMVDRTSQSKGTRYGEFDLLRCSGGLFEIERMLGSKNHFVNDALIKKLIYAMHSTENVFFKNNQEAHDLFVDFLNSITDFSFLNFKGLQKQYEIYDISRLSAIYFLKHMTREEYIGYCKTLLNGIFSMFEKNEILVMDCIFDDCEHNFRHYKEYTQNLKTIMVQRDPRDIYIRGIEKKFFWIPRDVKKFEKWYKVLLEEWPYHDDDCLNFRFEDLVLHYDTEITKLLAFLDLKQVDHKYKLSSFNPEISKKHIGRWKTRNDLKEEIVYIEKTLGRYCYGNESVLDKR